MASRLYVFFAFCLLATTLARHHISNPDPNWVEDSDNYELSELKREIRQLENANSILENKEQELEAELEKTQEKISEEIDTIEKYKQVFDKELNFLVEDQVKPVKECTWACPKWWFLGACFVGLIGVALCIAKKCF